MKTMMAHNFSDQTLDIDWTIPRSYKQNSSSMSKLLKNWVNEFACLPIELTKAVLYNFIWRERQLKMHIKTTSSLQLIKKDCVIIS